MSTLTNLPTTTLAYVPKTEPSFEFTKRKRWQDLLITELHNTHTFILSLDGKILYNSPAIATRFGWKSSELLNMDFRNLLGREEDQKYFQAAFNEAILEDHDSFELVVQLKQKKEHVYENRKDSTTSDDTLLRLKCSAICSPLSTHGFAGSTSMSKAPPCEFALVLAMPFSSKNTETLHSVMDLNTQIIRNVEKIIELREHLPADTVANVLNPGSGTQPVSMYATSSLYTGPQGGSKGNQMFMNPPGWKPSEVPSSLQIPTALSGTGFDEIHYGEEDMEVDRIPFSYGSTNMSTPSFDDSVHAEEGSKKKKLKRSQGGAERHVCIICGRTDSPEWRKGPQGPKTLCNACGLRWAKQVRKKTQPATSPLALPPTTAET